MISLENEFFHRGKSEIASLEQHAETFDQVARVSEITAQFAIAEQLMNIANELANK